MQYLRFSCQSMQTGNWVTNDPIPSRIRGCVIREIEGQPNHANLVLYVNESQELTARVHDVYVGNVEAKFIVGLDSKKEVDESSVRVLKKSGPFRFDNELVARKISDHLSGLFDWLSERKLSTLLIVPNGPQRLYYTDGDLGTKDKEVEESAVFDSIFTNEEGVLTLRPNPLWYSGNSETEGASYFEVKKPSVKVNGNALEIFDDERKVLNLEIRN